MEQDEFDTGARQLLNLGHTIGHGVEACSGYQISHGKAVAIGMTLVTRGAVARKPVSPGGPAPAGGLAGPVPPAHRHRLRRRRPLRKDPLRQEAGGGHPLPGGPHRLGKSVLHPIPVGQLLTWIEKGLGQ